MSDNAASAPMDDVRSDVGQIENNGGDNQQQTPQSEQGATKCDSGNTSPNNYSNGSGTNRTDICRDFLNNVCFRGNRCRFYHPPEVASNPDRNKEVIKDFCHDYQNKGCFRDSCRYVHCAREDMEEYMRTGNVTESLARALVAVTGQEVVDGRPLCKEFLSGRCSRGSRCRFWHINPTEERQRRQMQRVAGSGAAPSYGPGYGTPLAGYQQISQYTSSSGGSGGYGYRQQQDYNKRPRIEETPPAGYGGTAQMGTAQPPPTAEAYMALQDENIALRRKIDVLKQTVAELSAANDNMLAENNRLRAKLQVPSVGGPQSMNDPSSMVGSMATATLSGVLTSATQGLAAAPQSGTMPGGMAPDHLAAVSLAAAQSMAAAQQTMAMSSASDAVWSAAALRR